MSKILIIAQAPPLKSQTRPMDTTLLETWLKDAGYEFLNLEDVFEFEAVYDQFPGKNKYGAHKAPSKKQMDEHWPVLEAKIMSTGDHGRIWIMGNTAKMYIMKKMPELGFHKTFICTMHPSRRNLQKYRLNKHQVMTSIIYLLS